MRRLIVLAALAALIVVPTALATLPQGGQDDGTLSVRRGRGLVVLRFRGAVIGRIAHGSVRVTDPIVDDGQGAEFFGCDNTHRDVSDTTSVCRGDDVRFRAIGGRYSVKVSGSGIFLSAVGRGKVTMNGIGDPEAGIFNDGGYSFNGDDYQSLPDDPTTFILSAPPGG